MTEETQPTAIESRQLEVAQYQQNIAMYEAMLASLPSEWPERLVQYKAVENRHNAVAEIEDLADVTLVSKLWYAEDCKKFIRTETVEMIKSQTILETLQAL